MSEKELIVEESAPLTLTPIGQWRLKTWLARLPNGCVVRLRTINLLEAVRRGQVPNSLLPLARKVVAGGGLNMDKISDAEMTAMLDLMAWVTTQCVVYPTLWDGEGEPPADSVPLDWLTQDDQTAITNWALQGVTAEFAGFCAE